MKRKNTVANSSRPIVPLLHYTVRLSEANRPKAVRKQKWAHILVEEERLNECCKRSESCLDVERSERDEANVQQELRRG